MEPDSESVQEKWLEGWTVEDLSKWQSSDPHMSRVISWLKKGQGKPRWKDISRYGRNTKGRYKTVQRARQSFYWVGYKEEVARWCRRCDTCAMVKPVPHRKRAQMGQVPVGAPLQRIAVDVMGPLQRPKMDKNT